ncbi:DUF418 domain-containing protein [Rhodococcus sp. HNM0569]|uniref:DUF418 domain-containing protein n=1 Tax=Rhodococcus sp. HNM0569 TaxID=2716340 RepID=UPI00146F0404|nr:DUF418 domain-containing protein [Rhodococcus sp. HNM0569]NLU83254.1 DUF418 domain-containing protein [Rhodococcus sp. HNM0569]
MASPFGTTHRTDSAAVTGTARIRDVDALRGFALLGIFVVNITFMASAYPGNLVEDPAFSTPFDDAVRFVVSGLFSMKFYLLFSFLFGYSFVLQIQAAERAGAAFAPRMLRRILGLFALGAGHIVLLYSGDVLTTYAVACLVLLAVYRVGDRVAVVAAGAIYAFVALSLLVSAVFLDRSEFMPSSDEALVAAEEQTQSMLGSFADIVGQHLDGLGLLVVQAASLQGPTALAMFLLGMVAARRSLFSGLSTRGLLLRRVQWVGFPVGLVGGALFATLGADTSTQATLVSVVTAPFLTAAYVATLVRILHSNRLTRVRGALESVGRVALTNYLTQSLVGFVLFTGIGFGLAGQVSPPLLLLLAVVIFSLQALVSALWLRHHRYGPVEYLLRCFTNWSRPERAEVTAGKEGSACTSDNSRPTKQL